MQNGIDNPTFDDQEENKKNEEETASSIKDNKHLERDKKTWSNSIEFLMSCVALSVGFGNIWRFPFTAYENGGGAFLIPVINKNIY